MEEQEEPASKDQRRHSKGATGSTTSLLAPILLVLFQQQPTGLPYPYYIFTYLIDDHTVYRDNNNNNSDAGSPASNLIKSNLHNYQLLNKQQQ